MKVSHETSQTDDSGQSKLIVSIGNNKPEGNISNFSEKARAKIHYVNNGIEIK